MTIDLSPLLRKPDRYDIENERQAKLEAEFAAKRAMAKAAQ